MAKHLLTVALVAAALVVAGCGHAAQPAAPRIQPLEIKSFAQKWSVDINRQGGTVKSVFVRDDLIFVYTANATVYVVSRESGQLVQSETIPGGLAYLHPPVLLKDYIIYPTLSTLEIYDRKTGTLERSQRLPFAVRSAAVGYKSSLYLGADYAAGGRVVALDLTQKYAPTRWELMFPRAAVSAAPVYSNETVFGAAEDGSVAAVASDNRDPVWSLPDGVFRTGGPIVADLKADEFGIYVASMSGQLYCLNKQTGKIKWQYYAPAPLKDSPVITKGLVYQQVPELGLVAIDKIEGPDKTKPPLYNRKPRWIDGNATQFLGEDEKYTYVRRADNGLAALNKITGAVEFVSRRKDFVAFGTNTKDGIIYAATANGKLIAVQSILKPGGVGEVVFNAVPASSAPASLRAPDPLFPLNSLQ